jgi:hypothetical protein
LYAVWHLKPAFPSSPCLGRCTCLLLLLLLPVSLQDWCLQDLTAVAEGAAGCANRRAALFADETGASGWCPLSRYCLTELRDFVGVMASALPAVQSSASSGSGVRWNTLQLSAAGGQAASRAQDLALWHMQARHYRWGGGGGLLGSLRMFR